MRHDKKVDEKRTSELVAQKKNQEIKELRDTIKSDKVEIWKSGKGLDENRKIVYKYFTKKFGQQNFQNKIIFDGAINNKTNEYCAIEFPSGITGLGTQIGEAEQGIMFYIFMNKETYKRVVIHSTDTDTFTYTGLYYGIEGVNIDQTILMRCKNWYFRRKIVSGPNSNRIYIVDTKKLSQQIKHKYSNLKNPVLTFWVIWGVELGCDFIKGVHKLLQENQKTKTTEDFINKFFNEILPKHFSNPKAPLVNVTRIENPDFCDDTYYSVRVNDGDMEKLLLRCTTKSLSSTERKQLRAIFRNTEYVANYMINQYRIKSPELRKYPFPECTLKDEDGYSIFGYEEENNKIVQSLNIRL